MLWSWIHWGDQAQSLDLGTGRRAVRPCCTTGAIPWASSGEKEGISAWGAYSSGCLRPGLSTLECQSDNTARERMFKGAVEANSNPATCPGCSPKFAALSCCCNREKLIGRTDTQGSVPRLVSDRVSSHLTVLPLLIQSRGPGPLCAKSATC